MTARSSRIVDAQGTRVVRWKWSEGGAGSPDDPGVPGVPGTGFQTLGLFIVVMPRRLAQASASGTDVQPAISWKKRGRPLVNFKGFGRDSQKHLVWNHDP